MSTTIDNQKIPIHIDTHGNLYFEVNKNLFQLNIDKNDDPYFDVGNYEIVSNEVEIMKGKIVKSNKFVDDTYFPEDNGHNFIGTEKEEEPSHDEHS